MKTSAGKSMNSLLSICVNINTDKKIKTYPYFKMFPDWLRRKEAKRITIKTAKFIGYGFIFACTGFDLTPKQSIYNWKQGKGKQK